MIRAGSRATWEEFQSNLPLRHRIDARTIHDPEMRMTGVRPSNLSRSIRFLTSSTIVWRLESLTGQKRIESAQDVRLFLRPLNAYALNGESSGVGLDVRLHKVILGIKSVDAEIVVYQEVVRRHAQRQSRSAGTTEPHGLEVSAPEP